MGGLSGPFDWRAIPFTLAMAAPPAFVWVKEIKKSKLKLKPADFTFRQLAKSDENLTWRTKDRTVDFVVQEENKKKIDSVIARLNELKEAHNHCATQARKIIDLHEDLKELHKLGEEYSAVSGEKHTQLLQTFHNFEEGKKKVGLLYRLPAGTTAEDIRKAMKEIGMPVDEGEEQDQHTRH